MQPGAPPEETSSEGFPLPVGQARQVEGRVFILSGPSGVGKSTLIRELQQSDLAISYCVTATTRAQRAGEVHGRDYYFLSEQEFAEVLARGEFLEHSLVHQRYRYGVPLFSLRASLSEGNDVIMAPEVQGAEIIRRKLPQAVTIFLRPTSIEELAPRLDARQSETPEERNIRMQTAVREMERCWEYEYVVVNRANFLREAVEDVKAIIRSERLRVRPRTVTL